MKGQEEDAKDWIGDVHSSLNGVVSLAKALAVNPARGKSECHYQG